MNRIVIGLLGLALATGATVAAHAQDAAPGTVALSPEERSKVLEATAMRDEDDLPINGADRKIHGTMGMEMNSRGGHAIYGSTVVPLGDNATAAFSFLTGQSGRWR